MSDYNLTWINGRWRYALNWYTFCVSIENTPNRGTTVKSLPCRKFLNNASTSSFAKWLFPFFPPQHIKTPQRCATWEQKSHHCGWQKRMNVICSHTDCLLHILLSAVWHFFFFFALRAGETFVAWSRSDGRLSPRTAVADLACGAAPSSLWHLDALSRWQNCFLPFSLLL